MVQTLYAASSNAGKLRDFAAAARLRGFKILSLPGLATIPPPPEDQPTFRANAETKAVYYSRLLPGEMVLADDSGLEVDALRGAPGVRSARYAADAGRGFPSSCDAAESSCAGGLATAKLTTAKLTVDDRNNRYLLQQLAGVPEAQRKARYCCWLAAARDGRVEFTAQGVVEGRILDAPRGAGGFGYDPLFYLPELGQTMAEIDLERKDTLSHRGKALRALLAQLK